MKNIKGVLKRFTAISEGFTLVELLIVIALIAILSVAVLATINPIEQTNKARDSKFKNDSAEVLSAYERYYASTNRYPWNVVGSTIPQNHRFAARSTSDYFGVVGSVGTTGELIQTSELKSSFTGKEPFATSVADQDAMYVYHNGRDSNYVCYCPKATANRSGPRQSELKCLMGTLDTVDGASLENIGVNGCNTLPAGSNYSCAVGASGVANLICVPEGNISN
ncbi:type II secretion system protein [Candidatus Shapirobacteria bacterium]|nr:type II secretion system protein [Candidatus Shapirobacteria bacterium]